MTQAKRWLVTGVSSGFGRVLAEHLLARGDTVAGTLRKPGQITEFERLAPGRAHGILLDVTDQERTAPALGEAQARLGGLDVLVNNAGYGLFGALEETDDDEARQVMETNFFGTLNVTRAALPYFREQRSGSIVNFSSLAGVMGVPGASLYCAAKFAVEGFSEALAVELAPFGIRVMIVEPGGFRTNFAGGSLALARRQMADYQATPAALTRLSMSSYAGREPGDPVKAMAVLLQALEAEQPPLRLVLGADAVGAQRAKLARVGSEVDAWAAAASATTLDRSVTDTGIEGDPVRHAG